MKNVKLDLVSFLLLVIGIITMTMIFFPALTASGSDSSFLGYELAFGTDFVNIGSFASGQIVWSPLGILAYLTPLAAGLVAVFTKKRVLISFVLFTLGAILLFTMPVYTKATVTLFDSVTEINVDWSFSYGLIIAGVFAALGSGVCLHNLIYKK